MSKSLIKLIDAALLPAAVMICGKVLGLWITNVVFGLEWGIVSDPNDFFSVKIIYPTQVDQITATSYSNLIMFLAVFLGLLFMLIRAVFFHASHISPKMIARLATNNLLNLITDSFELYHKASVWIIMLWISFFALILNVLSGRAFLWTGLVSFFCAIFSSVLLLRDVMQEIDIARKNLNKLT